MSKLSIQKPTPTTISYTVSTRSATTSLSATIKRIIALSLRVLIGIFVLLTVVTKLSSTTASFSGLVKPLKGTAFGQLLDAVASQLPLPWILIISAGLLTVVLSKGYTEESLLVIRGLGVQTSTSSPTYLSTASTRFIPTHLIQDIFIHEAFKGFEVKFYLAIVVEGEEDVVVVFPSIMPKRHILEEVWRGARACLYEPRQSLHDEKR